MPTALTVSHLIWGLVVAGLILFYGWRTLQRRQKAHEAALARLAAGEYPVAQSAQPMQAWRLVSLGIGAAGLLALQGAILYVPLGLKMLNLGIAAVFVAPLLGMTLCILLMMRRDARLLRPSSTS